MLSRFPLAFCLFVAAAATSAAPRAAASDDAPGGACHGGVAKGLWNLPQPFDPGFAKGVLSAPLPGPVLQLRAKLGAKPGEPNEGLLGGVLMTLPEPGEAPQVVATVAGLWKSGPLGKGTFEAVIVEHFGGPFGPELPIGMIQGVFADAPFATPGGFDPAGHFAGVWKLATP